MKTLYLFVLIVLGAGTAIAQVPISADGQVPPALRNSPSGVPASGEALRVQALAKLEAQFKAADADGNGSLSAEEAKGFGFVARNFDAIDTGRRGAVSFEDLRSYLARAKAEQR